MCKNWFATHNTGTVNLSGNIGYFQQGLFTSEAHSNIIVSEIQVQKAWWGKCFNPYNISHAIKPKTCFSFQKKCLVSLFYSSIEKDNSTFFPHNQTITVNSTVSTVRSLSFQKILLISSNSDVGWTLFLTFISTLSMKT